MVQAGLFYSKDHEWVRVEGNRAFVGISDYAQNALGDVVYVELPEMGARLEAGAQAGVLESVKAVSEVYSPVGGEVCEVNGALEDAPELVNEAPYENYIFVLEAAAFDTSNLMDAAAYEAYLGTLEE